MSAMTVGEFISRAVDERVGVLILDENKVMDGARQNDKRPAYLRWAVPDEVVKNLSGDDDRRDYVFFVSVPRELGDRILAEADALSRDEAAGS